MTAKRKLTPATRKLASAPSILPSAFSVPTTAPRQVCLPFSHPFALTFAFVPPHSQTQQKQKRVQATALVQPTGHRITWTRNHTLTRDRAAGNMGLNEMAGAVLNHSAVLLINFGALRKFCASKPPLR